MRIENFFKEVVIHNVIYLIKGHHLYLPPMSVLTRLVLFICRSYNFVSKEVQNFRGHHPAEKMKIAPLAKHEVE